MCVEPKSYSCHQDSFNVYKQHKCPSLHSLSNYLLELVTNTLFQSQFEMITTITHVLVPVIIGEPRMCSYRHDL